MGSEVQPDQPAPVVPAPPVAQAPPVQVAPIVQNQAESEIDCGSTEDEELQKLRDLYLKRFGCQLPQPEKKSARSEIYDLDLNLIDLTNNDEEMEADNAAPVLIQVKIVVKTEPTEVAKADDNTTDPNRLVFFLFFCLVFFLPFCLVFFLSFCFFSSVFCTLFCFRTNLLMLCTFNSKTKQLFKFFIIPNFLFFRSRLH
jgi:hypothetical protein